jgi:thiol-disulfide isomerase/thioredoxin
VSPLRRVFVIAGIGGLAAAAGVVTHLFRIGRLGGGASPDIGETILTSRLTDLDGAPSTLAAFRGRILVVNYWATWCAPCREEIPMFVRLQQEFVDKNVQFVGIAIDQADKVREFAKEIKISYPLLIGGMDTLDLSRQAGNKAGVLPYTLVLDPSGRVGASLVGGLSEERMRSVLLAQL